ncbi:short-chain dehydrogenase/reductase family 9C member 7-like [Scylla paramamosain]|uniref:short-chain dehydrogenase/reductase family 9C member 7-like n=1 Tax=Scylla paramamosain TaxID=85552 RepID=UPI0030831AA5
MAEHYKMMVWAAGGVAAGMVLLAAHSWRRLRGRREVYGPSKVVVVTGCDSGIGYNVALNTLEWGCSVVATCLDPDGEAPRRLSEAGAVVVKLDLRHLQQDAFKELLSALNSLKDDDKDLWCLVNNAGVMTYAHCEWQTKEMVTSQVEVNLLGLIQVTKVLLPTLRRNKGRVVMVSSPAGQVAVPNMTVYAATKWGVEGFSHALRRELAPQGGSVVLVRPCNLPANTGILALNAAHLKLMLAAAPPETREDFGVAMMEAEQVFREHFQGSDQLPLPLNDRLLACFRSAIMNQNPCLTYSAAPLPMILSLDLLQLLPYNWVDFLVAKNFYDFILSFARNK